MKLVICIYTLMRMKMDPKGNTNLTIATSARMEPILRNLINTETAIQTVVERDTHVIIGTMLERHPMTKLEIILYRDAGVEAEDLLGRYRDVWISLEMRVESFRDMSMIREISLNLPSITEIIPMTDVSVPIVRLAPPMETRKSLRLRCLPRPAWSATSRSTS